VAIVFSLFFAIAQPFLSPVRVPLTLVQRMVQLVPRFVQILARLLVGALQILAQLVPSYFQLLLRFLPRLTALLPGAIRVPLVTSGRGYESDYNAAYSEQPFHTRLAYL
jgi:hypothetical protein